MAVCLATTATVMHWVRTLREVGCTVELDRDAGTLQAFDGDTCVYQGLQKGRGGPWIVRTRNSDRIKWSAPSRSNP
jgi:hypothetical protein